MCCGQKRSELRNSQTRTTVAPVRQNISNNTPPPVYTHTRSIEPPVATTSPTGRGSIGVRYLERSPIRVRGLISGVSYEFSGSQPVLQVDSRDAPALLNTRFFRRA
jgi:hypothetical protein